MFGGDIEPRHCLVRQSTDVSQRHLWNRVGEEKEQWPLLLLPFASECCVPGLKAFGKTNLVANQKFGLVLASPLRK